MTTSGNKEPTLADLVGLWLDENRPMFEIRPGVDKNMKAIHIKKAKLRNALVFIWSDNINIMRYKQHSLRLHMSVPTFFEQMKEHLDKHYFEYLKQCLKDLVWLPSYSKLKTKHIDLVKESLTKQISHYQQFGNFDVLVQQLIEARTRKGFSPESDIVPSL